MNVFRIGFILLTLTGVGIGVDKINDPLEDTTVIQAEEQTYSYMSPGYCHNNDNDGYFLEHMLDSLSEEEYILVQSKVDELLIKYDISIDDLFNDYQTRYDFMLELMEFIDGNDIKYHYHGSFHNYDGDEYRRFGMGMHN